MPNFTTLYEGLISNLKSILSSPRANDSNDLRALRSNICKTIKDLEKYEKLTLMTIPGESASDDIPNTFDHYWWKLKVLASEWETSKWAGGSRDREKVRIILGKIERAAIFH